MCQKRRVRQDADNKSTTRANTGLVLTNGQSLQNLDHV